MKIIIFKKAKLILSSIIVSLTIFVCLSCFIYKSPGALAVELSCDSFISEQFKDKISKLTQGEEKIAYLTFDDGPNKLATPKILDILKEKNIKATFFVIGKNVEENPEIVKRMYEEGHYVANHGYDHNNKNLYKSEESFIEEVTKTDRAIGNAIGIEDYSSHVFRFPNGFMSLKNKEKKKKASEILTSMNYVYIDWNCLNNDSIKKYTKSQLLNNLKRSAKDKKTLVVLMHDTKDVSDSSSVLEDSINYLQDQGYTFESFYDLM